MKVLHVLAQLPTRTGSGIYFTNVIDGLKKYDNIEQACIYATNPEYSFNILENQYEVAFESDSLPFPIVGMSDIMPYPNTLYKNMTDEMHDLWKKEFLKQLDCAKKEFNPDVILTHHLWILSSMVCDVFPDKKIIAFCHNTDIRQAKQNPHIKEKHVLSLNRLDKVFALSRLHYSDIKQVFDISKEKIVNIGAGYNEKMFFPLDKYSAKDKIELLYVGKFDESKGFYELIKAFKIIEKKYKNITLDLIGALKQENKDRIEKLTEKSPNIKIYNTKDQKEMADIMRTKDIFIMPSYFEGLGLIAVEALGSGLRVVSTKIEGLMELLGDELNSSDIIEYVDLPTIYDTDKAVEEEKPAFILRLIEKIEEMIKRTKEKREIEKELLEKVFTLSWKAKIEEIKEHCE